MKPVLRSAPAIIAHRGAAADAPENTAAAFDSALAQGADGIELDLQYSRDGEVVVYHDRRLDRVGLKKGHIGAYDWSDLAELDVGRWFTGAPTEQRMLRLHEVLARWGPRTHLYLEIKNYEGRRARERHRRLAEATAAAVVAAGLQSRVSILSFHGAALRGVHAVAPELALVRNVRWLPALLRLTVSEPPLAAVCVAIKRFGPAHAARLARLGVPVYAYTCDVERDFERARALAATAVISNRPAAARRWFELES